MNKAQLIAQMSQKSDLTKTQLDVVLNLFIETVTASLKKEEPVKLVGFGTFSTRVKAAHTAHNPKTREKVEVPAKKVVKFSVGKNLEDAINA